MAVEAERVVVIVEAQIAQAQAAVKNFDQTFSSSMSEVEKSATQAEGKTRRALNDIGESADRAGQRSRLLGYQISDIGTQLASGSNPFLILAQQAPQVANALEGTEGVAGQLASFFSGPWGAALLAAGSALGVLISQLKLGQDEAEVLKERLQQAAEGADAFATAQSLLGQMVDLTSEKLKGQNDVLKASIRLQALLAQEQARTERLAARQVIEKEGNRTVGGFGAIGPGGTAIGAPARPEHLVSDELRNISNEVLAGAPIDPAIKRLQSLASAGRVSVDTIKELQTQFVEFGQATEKSKAAQTILDYLDTGKLDPRLKPYQRPTKGRQEREVDSQFDEQLAKLDAQELALRVQLTGDIGERMTLNREQLKVEGAAYQAALREQVAKGQLSGEEAKTLLAKQQEAMERKAALLNLQYDNQLGKEKLALTGSDLEARRGALADQLDLARSEKERRKVRLAILDAEIELQRAGLTEARDRRGITPVAKQIAEARLAALETERAARSAVIMQETQTPGESFLRQVNRSGEQLGEDFDRVAVDGLKRLNDQLTDAIMNSKSLGDAFKNVANAIIADLLRIAIQQAIIKPLANALFNTGGGDSGGGFASIAQGIGTFFGRASGGHAAPNSIHRVNEHAGGVELLRMGPQGGTVIPLGQTRAAAPTARAGSVYNISVSADNSVTPAGFARGLAGEILAQAARMDAASYQQSMRDAPGAIRRASRYGS